MNKILRAYRFLKNLPTTVNTIRTSVQVLDEKSQSLSGNLQNTQAELNKTLSSFSDDMENIKHQQADISHTISTLKQPKVAAVQSPSEPTSNLQADNHELDGYYLAFEEKFRGSEDEIYKRLKESYSKLLGKELSDELKKLPVIDIGCGRGELLRLYKELGLKGVGIDLNESMVKRCIKLGYEANQKDALLYLKKQPASSVAVVSGIHIVEHIPFETLFELLRECFRVVAAGGFVLFETPNAENVVVGSSTFWYDSSHIKPVPADVLVFILQYVGFNETKVMRMHPDPELSQEIADEITKKMASKLFGPRDYAAIGYKSKKKITSPKSSS